MKELNREEAKRMLLEIGIKEILECDSQELKFLLNDGNTLSAYVQTDWDIGSLYYYLNN